MENIVNENSWLKENSANDEGSAGVSSDMPLTDVLPSTSSRMTRQSRRDTEPELRLRRELHALGLRYRVDHPLPGMPRRRADVVFTRSKVAVFVDGCFWHSCPEHGTRPANNASWWRVKLARNAERDRETDTHLHSLGWTVFRVWEHEDMKVVATDIGTFIRAEKNRLAALDSSTRGIRSK